MKPIRLGKAAGELNLGIMAIVEIFSNHGIFVDRNPNAKLTPEQYQILLDYHIGTQDTPIFKGNKLLIRVSKKIEPGILIVSVEDKYHSLMNLRDLSKNMLEAERLFNKFKKHDHFRVEIESAVDETWFRCRYIDEKGANIKDISSIKIGELVEGEKCGELFSNKVYELENGFVGLLNKEITGSGSLYVTRKDLVNEILYLSILATTKEKESIMVEEIQDEDSFISLPDFKDWDSFEKSKYYSCASEKEIEALKACYAVLRNPIAPVITVEHPIKLYFEFNSASWELVKSIALAIGYEGDVDLTNDEAVLKGLNDIQNENYWIQSFITYDKERLNIFNEKYSIVTEVERVDDESIKFRVIHFNEGRKNDIVGRSKRFSMGDGAQALNGKIEFINPYNSYSQDFDKYHNRFFEGLNAKSGAEKIINSLKQRNSEVLKAEGKALEIFQKYLDYEIERIKSEQPPAMPLVLFERIPNVDGFVSYRLDSDLFKSLANQNSSDEDVMHVVISKKIVTEGKKAKEVFHSVERGIVKGTVDRPILDLFNSDQLDPEETFYISPIVSTRAQDDQKKIIRQFLNGEINVDHIERLFTNPKSILKANLEIVELIDPILNQATTNSEAGKQVLAVQKALGNQNLFLIQGPPGTGKTTVITEIVKQLVSRGERILVSGQTNVAVDNVLEKLIPENEIGKLRIGNKNSVSMNAQAYTIEAQIKNYKSDLSLFAKNQQLIFELFNQLPTNEVLDNLDWCYNPSFLEASKDLHKRTLNFLTTTVKRVDTDNLKTVFKEWELDLSNGMSELLEPLLYLSANVTFGTCVGAGINKILRSKDFKFDTVIIDEAGKANLSETLAAMSLGKKIILVGDHKQLPPYFDSEAINPDIKTSFPNSKFGKRYSIDDIKHALTVSFFEFIKKKEKQGLFPSENVIMLDEQHRMHPHIGEFVSKHFYQDDSINGLKMGKSTSLNTLNISEKYSGELVFFDTSKSKDGREKRSYANDSKSVTNPFEASIIVNEILCDLESSDVEAGNVAIVSPYSAQVNLIRNELKKSDLKRFLNVDIATLDSFQGKEFDVIIFSFTRSIPTRWNEKMKVGFLDDSRRLNVAFSRAKKKLIMVGDAQTLTNPIRHDETFFPFSEMFTGLIQACQNQETGSFHLRSGALNLADLSEESDVEEPLSQEEFLLRRKSILSNLQVGQILEGKVKNIVSYGAFVDLGGVDGLVHITDLSWCRLNHPNEIVKLDQKLNVVILDFDDDKKRIALGIKQLQPHPWDDLDENLKVGVKVSGKVLLMADYGAFVEIIPGVEGLIHISEMSWSQHVRSAKELMNVGDSVEAVILSLQRNERKMSLGVKQLLPNPWDVLDANLKDGDKVSGKVIKLVDEGVYVEVAPGVEGLIQISEISWSQNLRTAKEFMNVGDSVEAVILKLDRNDRKMSLGIKQLLPDPWADIEIKYAVGTKHKAKVRNFANFGVFVELEKGIDGMIHKSDIATNLKVKHPSHFFKTGEVVDVLVFNIDKDKRRISLKQEKNIQENGRSREVSKKNNALEDLKNKYKRDR
jgi:ribosomal protein S1/superfamily I DNA and/or RNA helicase